MTAQLIDGTAIAQKVRDEVKEKVTKRLAEGKSQPGLATVLVGERVDSAAYVRMKQKACADLGMTSFHHPRPGGYQPGRPRKADQRVERRPESKRHPGAIAPARPSG